MRIPSRIDAAHTYPPKLDALGRAKRNTTLVTRMTSDMPAKLKADIGRLDLRHVRPSDLARVVVQLVGDGKLSESAASEFIGFRRKGIDDFNDDRPFDFMAAVADGKVGATQVARYYPNLGVIQRYENIEDSARGLRHLINALHGGRGLHLRA